MDGLAFDQMLPEYQEKREEAERETHKHTPEPQTTKESFSTPSSTSSSSSPLYDYGSGTTVPVSDETERDLANSGSAERPQVNAPASQSSSTSSSDFRSGSSRESSSLYQPGFLAPTINYDRDNPAQKLIAVIGREFDQPNEIASKLQKLVPKQATNDIPVAKFVSFTVKRKMLLKGTFESKELQQHDLICMCYNASEARILLTGTDGFYSSLLRHIEALLGPNKVAFAITNYNPISSETENTLISQALKTRLSHQEPLRQYLDKSQVLSWSDEPSELHVNRLIELANLELNPQSFFANPNCCFL